MSAGLITVVGVTEAGVASLTGAAMQAIEHADVVFGGARHMALLAPKLQKSECIEWAQPLTQSFTEIDARAEESVVVLASGDPHWHGIANTLVRRYGEARVRTLPAVGAFSLAAAALGWPLEQAHCRSLHGHDLCLLALWCAPGARLLLLTDGADAPRAIAAELVVRGFAECRVRVFERLGGESEQLGEWIEPAQVTENYDALNLLAIEVPDALTQAPLGLTPGLPDRAFQHDGQLTKRSVRAITLSRLRPVAGQCLWDLGAGCGSVAIEWVRAAIAQSAGTPQRETVLAHAVESAPARVAMIEHNCRALGTPYIRVYPERIESALAKLPAPNAIFIGGGLSQWRGVAADDSDSDHSLIDYCLGALLPGGRLVVNAVTMESEALLLAAHAQHGGELERLSVSASRAVGRFSAMQPSMSVLQYSVEIECK